MLDSYNFNKRYLEIEDPRNIRRELGSDFSFHQWLRGGTIKDLQQTLTRFEEVELFEDCVIINNILQQKINTITTTIDIQL